jgi:predicted nicotinamide N-methyase
MIPGLDLTLSDGNDEVLKACRRNLEANQASSIHLYKLDWHCLPKKRQKYDTILASDCAYKYTDIQSLAVTMKALLKPTGKIHIFAPHNRGALQQLLLELRDGQSMSVVIRGLELNRYRLKSHGEEIEEEEEEALFCSQQVARFLHITASHSIKTSQQEGKHESIDGID